VAKGWNILLLLQLLKEDTMRTSDDEIHFGTPESVIELAQWAGLFLKLVETPGITQSPNSQPTDPATPIACTLRVIGDPAVVAEFRPHVVPFRDQIIDLIRGPPFHGLVIPHDVPVTAMFGAAGQHQAGELIPVKPGEPLTQPARSEYLTEVARRESRRRW
jgi:hypothetical protein